jgi:hypothetical protein
MGNTQRRVASKLAAAAIAAVFALCWPLRGETRSVTGQGFDGVLWLAPTAAET